MSELIAMLERHAIEAIAGLVVTAAGAVAAWLRKKTREWDAVRATVEEVEKESTIPGVVVPGRVKRERALSKLRQTNPGLPARRASELIERAVEESERPPPLPPRR